MQVKINLNDSIKVKLNEAGHKELERQHKELKKIYPSIKEFKRWEPDEDGYHSIQLHELMNRFGHMMFNGGECPIETDIIVES